MCYNNNCRKGDFENKPSGRAQDNVVSPETSLFTSSSEAFQKFCEDLSKKDRRPLQIPQSILYTTSYRRLLQQYSWVLLLLRTLALITLVELFLLFE